MRVESARQLRDRERDREIKLVDRSALSLDEACIHPTAAEVCSATVEKRHVTFSDEKSTALEEACVVGILEEYAEGKVIIHEKKMSDRGNIIWHFTGKCPVCKEIHRHDRWIVVNNENYPMTTLIQCKGKRRVVPHMPF